MLLLFVKCQLMGILMCKWCDKQYDDDTEVDHPEECSWARCECKEPLGEEYIDHHGIRTWICADCQYEIDEDRYTFEE